MRMYECFCDHDVDITENNHVWTLVPQATIKRLESTLDEFDGPQLNDAERPWLDETRGLARFLHTYKSYKEPSERTVQCPFCNGISIYELRGNRFATLYHLPKKHHEHFSLARPDQLHRFTCTCGKTVDTSNMQNQWVMIPEEDEAFEPLMDVFVERGGVESYYRQLYTLGRRVISCPHCQGITVAQCDAKGNGVSADYYSRSGERLGDEFDVRVLDD